MNYRVIVERSANGFSAYVPNLPGVVAAGSTLEEVSALIEEAIAAHVSLLRELGMPVPEPPSA